MTKVVNPYPLYLDGRGALLDAGNIYVGAANTNPETVANRLQCFWDEARSIAASQPLRTLGGVVVNGQNPALVFLAEDNYSMTIKDVDGVLVHYIPSATEAGDDAVEYQPLDSDLTAIAALATTAYGRNLLALADQVALRSATGIPDPLPLAGGTMSGNIGRTGAGSHLYNVAPGMTSGRVFLTAAGAADPTGSPGDIWLTY